MSSDQNSRADEVFHTLAPYSIVVEPSFNAGFVEGEGLMRKEGEEKIKNIDGCGALNPFNRRPFKENIIGK